MLSRKICKQCLARNGLTLSDHEWSKKGLVLCPPLKNSEDGFEVRSIYRNPPESCPYLVEHIVNQKDG